MVVLSGISSHRKPDISFESHTLRQNPLEGLSDGRDHVNRLCSRLCPFRKRLALLSLVGIYGKRSKLSFRGQLRSVLGNLRASWNHLWPHPDFQNKARPHCPIVSDIHGFSFPNGDCLVACFSENAAIRHPLACDCLHPHISSFRMSSQKTSEHLLGVSVVFRDGHEFCQRR